ncbi:hypothetical protein [Gelatiniphilus marinus]|uniref:Uncharacterized protein n=1 Tax=Gelatiniphilus marinus TaxID=1759464 RepID=A0ABW5JQ29_9FLAO
MKTNYLLPNKFKIYGWILLGIGIILGIYLKSKDFETNILVTNVISALHENNFLYPEKGYSYFKVIENDIIDEICALLIIIGGILVGFSKEKIEDEYIYKLRKDSLVWAIITNYIILMLTIIFVYNFTFFDVLVFNMFTPLLFFIIRFNFLKLKSRSHEE